MQLTDTRRTEFLIDEDEKADRRLLSWKKRQLNVWSQDAFDVQALLLYVPLSPRDREYWEQKCEDIRLKCLPLHEDIAYVEDRKAYLEAEAAYNASWQTKPNRWGCVFNRYGHEMPPEYEDYCSVHQDFCSGSYGPELEFNPDARFEMRQAMLDDGPF